MKLRYKLIVVFVTLSLISVITISMFGYNYIANDSKKNINLYLQAKTNEVMEKLDSWLTYHSQVMTDLSTFLQDNVDITKITRENLNIYQKYSDISDIYIGFSNKNFISAQGWLPPKGYNPTIRPWYLQAKSANVLNFSDPYLDMTTKKYAISIGIPLHNSSGAFTGILAEDVLLTTIISKVKNIDLEGLGYGFLIDRNGTALYHPNNNYINTNLKANKDTKGIITRMLSEKNGQMDYSLNNEDKIMNFRQMPSTGWILAAVVYKDLAYQSNYKLRDQFIMFVTITFILLVLAALFFSRTLTKRIILLKEEAKKLSSGNLNTNIIVNGNDEVSELAHSFNDMSESLSKTIRDLQKSEEKYRDLVENSADYIYSFDMEGRFTAANAKLINILGIKASDLIGKKVEQLNRSKNSEAIWTQLHNKAIAAKQIMTEQLEDILIFGEIRSVDITFCPLYSDFNKHEIVGITATVRDISEIKKYERSVHRLAYYDPLTELPNRVLLLESLNQLVIMCDAYKTKFAVMLVNLDEFKKINDALGHPIGDIFLKTIAANFRAYLNPNCIISRIGGDEFIIIAPNINKREEVNEVIEAVFNILGKPYNISNNELYVTASMGVTIYPDDTDKISEIIENVDTAMYRAKKSGKNHYQFFNEDMKKKLKKRVMLENQLRYGMQNNEFRLFYQPIFHASTNKIRGFEALIRWFHSEGNIVQPIEFIYILEETGQINQIGEWVLREACEKQVKWKKDYGIEITISVNISPIQLKNKNFVLLVKRIIEETRIDPNYLELEITEGVLIDSFEAVKVLLDELTKLGVKLSIDDFGTGYSSLSYLKELSFDTLKIDKAFIADIENCNIEVIIAGPIVSLVHSMKLEIIAEGVETPVQLEYLKQFNCDFIQGYLLSKPLPEEEVVRRFEAGEFR